MLNKEWTYVKQSYHLTDITYLCTYLNKLVTF